MVRELEVIPVFSEGVFDDVTMVVVTLRISLRSVMFLLSSVSHPVSDTVGAEYTEVAWLDDDSGAASCTDGLLGDTGVDTLVVDSLLADLGAVTLVVTPVTPRSPVLVLAFEVVARLAILSTASLLAVLLLVVAIALLVSITVLLVLSMILVVVF